MSEAAVYERVEVMVLPMIRDSDNRLIAFMPDELDFVFDVQNRLAVFLASCVPDCALDSSRVPFFAVFTRICELHPLFPVPIYGYRTLEVFLAPTLRTTVQAIGSIVGV